jgi:hypothetical protein
MALSKLARVLVFVGVAIAAAVFDSSSFAAPVEGARSMVVQRHSAPSMAPHRPFVETEDRGATE